MKKFAACLLLGALSQSVWALDTADQQRLNGLQQSWAHIQYELPADQRTAAFEKLRSSATARNVSSCDSSIESSTPQANSDQAIPVSQR